MTQSPKPRKNRLDQVVVERGLCPDLRAARAWIMTGKVLVDDVVRDKPGAQISNDASVRVRGRVAQYASRGGVKLQAALDRFDVAPRGACVLDAGASTGGFTDCLLQRGARRVFAVDVGHGQLRGKLASDPRVVNMERTNIGDLVAGALPEPIDLCVADLSYLSLAHAIPLLRDVFIRPVELICLVKPLFEGVAQERKQDLVAMAPALARVCNAVDASSLVVVGLMPSPILGNRESREFLMHVRQSPAAAATDELLSEAIAEAKNVACVRRV